MHKLIVEWCSFVIAFHCVCGWFDCVSGEDPREIGVIITQSVLLSFF